MREIQGILGGEAAILEAAEGLQMQESFHIYHWSSIGGLEWLNWKG